MESSRSCRSARSCICVADSSRVHSELTVVGGPPSSLRVAPFGLPLRRVCEGESVEAVPRSSGCSSSRAPCSGMEAASGSSVSADFRRRLGVDAMAGVVGTPVVSSLPPAEAPSMAVVARERSGAVLLRLRPARPPGDRKSRVAMGLRGEPVVAESALLDGLTGRPSSGDKCIDRGAGLLHAREVSPRLRLSASGSARIRAAAVLGSKSRNVRTLRDISVRSQLNSLAASPG
mmetsp:Transcript_83318/g.244279  ORF Transcript_83318/g.244279 Transcript_83318/m.244279 type:complete len:232 (+) Transcript_83318:1168-1863(+)